MHTKHNRYGRYEMLTIYIQKAGHILSIDKIEEKYTY